jgi:hypothetical protein
MTAGLLAMVGWSDVVMLVQLLRLWNGEGGAGVSTITISHLIIPIRPWCPHEVFMKRADRLSRAFYEGGVGHGSNLP